METSILNATKKVVGVSATDTSFDEDIIMHINTALATLNQLGVGPEGGFSIADDTATWYQLLGSDKRYLSAKSYIYTRTKLLFDPPTTSYMLDALKEQMRELEWRLSTVRETLNFEPEVETVLDGDLDGGDPAFDASTEPSADGGAP